MNFVGDAVVADVADVAVVAVVVATVDHDSERETWCSSCCCDWWLQGFVITFAALIVDVARANEAAVVVPYCELIVVLGFDAYVIDVHDVNICISSCRVSSCYCCDKSFYWYWSSCWCCSSGSSRSSRSVNHDCTFEGVDCVLFID